MRVTRWPLHPRPIAGEELSSWLGRIAVLYELPVKDLLVHDLGHPELSDVELDLAPPETLLTLLSERTGVSIGRIRSMTLKGWTRAWVGRGKPGRGALLPVCETPFSLAVSESTGRQGSQSMAPLDHRATL